MVGGRGDPTERAVVSTANYVARDVRRGLRDAAAARRPQVPGRGLPAGRRAGVRRSVGAGHGHPARASPGPAGRWSSRCSAGTRPSSVQRTRTDGVEGVGGGPPQDRDDALTLAQEIRAAVVAATRLTCSVGIGNNKLQAKIATDFGKPEPGVLRHHRRGPGSTEMGERPTTAHCGRSGAGPRRSWRRSASTPSSQLAAADVADPGRGARTHDGPVVPPPRPRGRHQSRRRHALRAAGARPRGDLPDRPRDAGRDRGGGPRADARAWSPTSTARADLAARVGIKVRFRPFFTVTRSLTLPTPTNDPALLADAAVSLLERVEQDRPIRLLGVRLEMVEPDGGY